MMNDYTNLIIEGIQIGDQIGGPTELAKILTDSLSANKRFDEQDLRQRYLNWWKSDAFDTGPTYANVFNKIDKLKTQKSQGLKNIGTFVTARLAYGENTGRRKWYCYICRRFATKVVQQF